MPARAEDLRTGHESEREMMEFLTADIHGTPVWNWALQLLAFGTAYRGAQLNSKMKISGFYVWMVSNVALGILNAYAGLWLLFVLAVLFFRINVLGTLHWAEEHPEQCPKWLEGVIAKRIEKRKSQPSRERRASREDRRKGDRRKDALPLEPASEETKG